MFKFIRDPTTLQKIPDNVKDINVYSRVRDELIQFWFDAD